RCQSLTVPFVPLLGPPPRASLLPYTTLFRSRFAVPDAVAHFFAQRRFGVDAFDVYGRVIESHEGGTARIRFGGDMALDALPQARSEEHTSELQSRENLVCRLLLEKKNTRAYM